MFKAHEPLGLHYPPQTEPPVRPSLLDLVHALAVFAALVYNGFLLAAMPTSIHVTSTRVWPAQDYTRVTLESREPIRHRLLSLKDPERLVLDLEDVALTASLAALAEKVGAHDPYVKAVRVGRFKPDVVRLVFDLKAEVKPEAFTLAPAGDYGHRVVLDLYPLVAPDPLRALLERLQAEQSLLLHPPAAPTERGPAPPSASPPSPPASPPAIASLPPERGTGQRAQPAARRLIIVAIDAGHGGEDPGARGRGGTNEKDVTLAIARKLKARIDAEPHMHAVLTRDGDYYIALHQRVAKARRVNADLFVSVHADAFIRPHARGSSVFALSERGATSAAASWLARRENEADLIGGVNLDLQDPHLKRTLLDLSQTATIKDSLQLGKAVLSELGGINTLHKPQVEQAGFAVLKAPDIPSILVETAFISNPEEELRLRSSAYQERMADALASGIKRYFAKNPPLARERMARIQ